MAQQQKYEEPASNWLACKLYFENPMSKYVHFQLLELFLMSSNWHARLRTHRQNIFYLQILIFI